VGAKNTLKVIPATAGPGDAKGRAASASKYDSGPGCQDSTNAVERAGEHVFCIYMRISLLVSAGALGVMTLPNLFSSEPVNQTPKKPVTDEYQGVKVQDDYQWLEKDDDPAVKAWSDAQNQRTRKYLDKLPDFAASAEYLINEKWTRPEKLAVLGGSNGGLLMGAMFTQHPDLVRAVVSAVGIYDMLRVELAPNGAFNVTEFGTVRDPDQFKALYAYSPYHHVTDSTKYPSILFMTGANDGRVAPYHSRKMLARLSEANKSSNPILLRTSTSSGHGIGTALSERIKQLADEYSFLFAQLGMTRN
jgi:protease II